MRTIAILKSRLDYMGGLERYAIAIAQAFAKKGLDACILTTGSPPPVEGVKVHSLCDHSSSSLFSIPAFNQAVDHWLKQHPSDLVFGLDRNSFQTHYRAGNGTHRSYLEKKSKSWLKQLLFKVDPKHRLILRKEKKLFENPLLQILFVNSKMVKEEILKYYQVPPSKIQVVHNGVDFKKYPLEPIPRPSCCKMLHLDPSFFQFLFVGNNYERKGLPLLLKALSRIKDRAFELTIIGKDKKISKYQALAKQLHLEGRVHFMGPQTQLLPFYQAADCLVLPTLYDPFANVTIEALAMGLFVITSPFNGGQEALSKSTGRVLSQLKDPQELTDALLHALSLNSSFEKKCEIRKTIQHLDINTQLDKIVSLTMKNC